MLTQFTAELLVKRGLVLRKIITEKVKYYFAAKYNSELILDPEDDFEVGEDKYNVGEALHDFD